MADSLDGDALAGVVDQFGAMTREELRRAVEEVRFRSGEEDVDDRAVDRAIDAAVADLHLVAVDRDDGEVLAPGPAALPTLPEGADDLPYVLDVPTRELSRSTLVDAAERELRAAAARAVTDDDEERMRALLDATYDLEAWAPEATVAGVRDRLDAALAGDDAPGDRQ